MLDLVTELSDGMDRMDGMDGMDWTGLDWTFAAARPVVSVFSKSGDNTVVTTVTLPSVFTAPIRADVVNFVHTNVAKKQASGLRCLRQGRSPDLCRVLGAGQAAFGNMCRGGRMFAPTKVWRRWHVKTNLNQKRFATASALAASALPALVLARGHKIEQINEIPLVVDSGVESLTKTKDAVALLKALNAYTDIEKVVASKKLRAASRSLVIYSEDNGLVRAFRNIPGIELAPVSALNLLQLAPGGHVGRFVIWTQAAFEKLDALFGSTTEPSQLKKGYRLPQPLVSNPDLTRLINSDEIQAVVKPAGQAKTKRPFTQHKNPSRTSTMRRTELLKTSKVVKKPAKKVAGKRKLAYVQTLLSADH
ncbi:ribosomal protein L4 domain-containing protein [Chytridium lagenaria]|nr:ribosomal protein L4 domain-containing protein [Chytridium lagenaria]